MRKTIVTILCQALVLFVVAQSNTTSPNVDHKNIIGLWQGHYEQAGINKSLTMEFKEVNGQLECYVDIPGRGLKSARFKIMVCAARDFHLERTGIDKTQSTDNTYIMFVGKPDGDRMTGHYKFGNSCTTRPAPSFSVSRSDAF
jgi:hypothetical protein